MRKIPPGTVCKGIIFSPRVTAFDRRRSAPVGKSLIFFLNKRKAQKAFETSIVEDGGNVVKSSFFVTRDKILSDDIHRR